MSSQVCDGVSEPPAVAATVYTHLFSDVANKGLTEISQIISVLQTNDLQTCVYTVGVSGRVTSLTTND